jgi:CHASE2 domain-containing sensor protein
LPRLQRLRQIQEWLACLAALSAFWIVFRVRRSRALPAGIALIFTALVVSFLVFQAYFLWCPPMLPAALIGVGAVVGFIFGRGQSQQPTLESSSASQ